MYTFGFHVNSFYSFYINTQPIIPSLLLFSIGPYSETRIETFVLYRFLKLWLYKH